MAAASIDLFVFQLNLFWIAAAAAGLSLYRFKQACPKFSIINEILG
jgi:hypothetical protein